MNNTQFMSNFNRKTVHSVISKCYFINSLIEEDYKNAEAWELFVYLLKVRPSTAQK